MAVLWRCCGSEPILGASWKGRGFACMCMSWCGTWHDIITAACCAAQHLGAGASTKNNHRVNHWWCHGYVQCISSSGAPLYCETKDMDGGERGTPAVFLVVAECLPECCFGCGWVKGFAWGGCWANTVGHNAPAESSVDDSQTM